MGKHVIIETPGIKIRVENNALLIPKGTAIEHVPLSTIDYIVVTRGVALTSDLLYHASENDVFIFVKDFDGTIVSITYPLNYSGKIKLHREQIRSYDDERGTHLAKTWAKTSITTKAQLLYYLGKNRKEKEIGQKLIEKSKEILKYAENINRTNGKIDDIRNQLMLNEAQAGEIYFKALSIVIPQEYNYPGKRTRKPPKDMANAAISYANSIVREIVLHATLLSGLNPFYGYLHTDYPNRKSLVLDIAEEFLVPIAHLPALDLLARKQLKIEDYTTIQQAVFLDYNGRLKIRKRIQTTLKRKIGQKTIEKIIYEQPKNLAEYLQGKTQEYTPPNLLPNIHNDYL